MKNNYSLIEDRRMQIFRRLINEEHLSYQQLSDEYYVSRSSIAKDIAYLKTLFVKENYCCVLIIQALIFKEASHKSNEC